MLATIGNELPSQRECHSDYVTIIRSRRSLWHVHTTGYWLVERDPDHAVAFAKAAFHRYFGEGRSLRSTGAVLALAGGYTDKADSLRCWLDTDEARQVLRKRTAEALDKGVFGSPFFLVGREPFWGWDRLPMIETWLERRAS